MVGHLERRQFGEVVTGHVDLGEGDHSVPDAEQLEDPQVLLALRFPALGRGHDEQAGVDPADPGEHVAQEPDVARHVDERQLLAGGERGVGEAEVDGETATLLLLEAGPGRCR